VKFHGDGAHWTRAPRPTGRSIPWGEKGRRRRGEEPPLRARSLFSAGVDNAAPRFARCARPFGPHGPLFRAERTEGEKFHQTFIAYMFPKKAHVNVYSDQAFAWLNVTSCVFVKKRVTGCLSICDRHKPCAMIFSSSILIVHAFAHLGPMSALSYIWHVLKKKNSPHMRLFPFSEAAPWYPFSLPML
jgi:hypothetical protein